MGEGRLIHPTYPAHPGVRAFKFLIVIRTETEVAIASDSEKRLMVLACGRVYQSEAQWHCIMVLSVCNPGVVDLSDEVLNVDHLGLALRAEFKVAFFDATHSGGSSTIEKYFPMGHDFPSCRGVPHYPTDIGVNKVLHQEALSIHKDSQCIVRGEVWFESGGLNYVEHTTERACDLLLLIPGGNESVDGTMA